MDGYDHCIIGVERGDNTPVAGENRGTEAVSTLDPNRLIRRGYPSPRSIDAIYVVHYETDGIGSRYSMQFRSSMPVPRVLRALRFLRVFRGWDKLLRLCFHPDRQDETTLEFPFAGVRYPGSTAYLVDWSAFF